MSLPYIAIALAVLLVIAVLQFFTGRKKAAKLTPLAGLAFGLLISGIVFGDNRLIGYGLIGTGVVLSVVDVVLKYRKYKSHSRNIKLRDIRRKLNKSLKSSIGIDLYNIEIFCIGIFGVAVIDLLYWLNIIPASSDVILANIYFITAIIILQYTKETHFLKKVAQDELVETRKQTQYERRPYLRLQWKDRSCIAKMYEISTDWRPNIIEGKKREFTSLELINDGRGLARNIEIRNCIVEEKEIRLLNVPTISSLGGAVQLRFAQSDISELTIENRLLNIFIIVLYEDIESDRYLTIFQSDESVNDGFSNVFQDKISDGRNIGNIIEKYSIKNHPLTTKG